MILYKAHRLDSEFPVHKGTGDLATDRLLSVRTSVFCHPQTATTRRLFGRSVWSPGLQDTLRPASGGV